jgi:hypothetical protein
MPYLFICLVFAVTGGVIGRIKGSSFVLWFLISGLLPVVGVLAAVLYRFERDEPRRECSRCGRMLKLYDQVCMGCGLDLEFPAEPLPAESQSPAVARR